MYAQFYLVIFPALSAYSVTNGLAAPAVAAEAINEEQEDYKNNNPPDPAPASVIAVVPGAPAVAAAVIAAAVIAAAAVVPVAPVVVVPCAVVTLIAAAVAIAGNLFIHGKNLLNMQITI